MVRRISILHASSPPSSFGPESQSSAVVPSLTCYFTPNHHQAVPLLCLSPGIYHSATSISTKFSAGSRNNDIPIYCLESWCTTSEQIEDDSYAIAVCVQVSLLRPLDYDGEKPSYIHNLASFSIPKTSPCWSSHDSIFRNISGSENSVCSGHHRPMKVLFFLAYYANANSNFNLPESLLSHSHSVHGSSSDHLSRILTIPGGGRCPFSTRPPCRTASTLSRIPGTELLPWHDHAMTVCDHARLCMTTQPNCAFAVLPMLNAVCLLCNCNNYHAPLSLASDMSSYPSDMFNNHVNTSGNSNITLIILPFFV